MQQEYVSIIEESGVRMLNIINDIVDISKIEAGLMEVNVQQVNINKQIEFIYTFFKPQIREKDCIVMKILYLKEKLL
jgi:signal transduction histidine kinase